MSEMLPDHSGVNGPQSLLAEMGCLLEEVGADATITHYRDHSDLPTPTIFGMVLMLKKQQRRAEAYPTELKLLGVPVQPEATEATLSLADQLSGQRSS